MLVINYPTVTLYRLLCFFQSNVMDLTSFEIGFAIDFSNNHCATGSQNQKALILKILEAVLITHSSIACKAKAIS
jgi:hypothetical protein